MKIANTIMIELNYVFQKIIYNPRRYKKARRKITFKLFKKEFVTRAKYLLLIYFYLIK